MTNRADVQLQIKVHNTYLKKNKEKMKIKKHIKSEKNCCGDAKDYFVCNLCN